MGCRAQHAVWAFCQIISCMKLTRHTINWLHIWTNTFCLVKQIVGGANSKAARISMLLPKSVHTVIQRTIAMLHARDFIGRNHMIQRSCGTKCCALCWHIDAISGEKEVWGRGQRLLKKNLSVWTGRSRKRGRMSSFLMHVDQGFKNSLRVYQNHSRTPASQFWALVTLIDEVRLLYNNNFSAPCHCVIRNERGNTYYPSD